MKYAGITLSVLAMSLMVGCSQVEKAADTASANANQVATSAKQVATNAKDAASTASSTVKANAGKLVATASAKPSPPGVNIGEAPAGTYKSEAGHAYIAFTYLHQGYSKPVLRWGEFEATIELDPANPENTSLSVTIPAASIDSGVAKFDEHLVSADFFDVANHPVITFKSTNMEQRQIGKGRVTGDLTMKGITKPIKLDVKLNKIGENFRSKVPMFGISATGVIKRSDWDLGKYAPSVGDDVELTIEVEFQKEG